MDLQQFMYRKVMIVDDTQIDRYVASVVIKQYKFAEQLLEFDMATKALEYIQDNMNKPENLPQLILLDINMPLMDGFQFLEQLSALPETVAGTSCIVMLSSSLNPDDHKRAADNSYVKTFVNKPLSRNKLDEILAICNGKEH